VKPLDVKKQWEAVKWLIRDYKSALGQAWISRALLYAKSNFSNAVLRDTAREILFADGDWEKAKDALRRLLPNAERAKLFTWADKLKGGAK
jgi:hypothetical protein